MANIESLIFTFCTQFYEKKSIVCCIPILFFVSIAQKKVLVQGIYPNIFIQHKVVSGETLYSIGKLYHFTAAQLSQQNGLNENAMLAIDKVMKINLTPQNFTQDGQSAESESLVPIHHIVQKGENLYRISQTYGKIRMIFT
jgi:LysM repeat protein